MPKCHRSQFFSAACYWSHWRTYLPPELRHNSYCGPLLSTAEWCYFHCHSIVAELFIRPGFEKIGKMQKLCRPSMSAWWLGLSYSWEFACLLGGGKNFCLHICNCKQVLMILPLIIWIFTVKVSHGKTIFPHWWQFSVGTSMVQPPCECFWCGNGDGIVAILSTFIGLTLISCYCFVVTISIKHTI